MSKCIELAAALKCAIEMFLYLSTLKKKAWCHYWNWIHDIKKKRVQDIDCSNAGTPTPPSKGKYAYCKEEKNPFTISQCLKNLKHTSPACTIHCTYYDEQCLRWKSPNP